jgi:hypothetical protein
MAEHILFFYGKQQVPCFASRGKGSKTNSSVQHSQLKLTEMKERDRKIHRSKAAKALPEEAGN